MIQKIHIPENEAGLRLDRWLKKRYPSLNYAFTQKLFRTGQIRVDGKRAKGTYVLKAGEEVRLPEIHLSEIPQKKPALSVAKASDLQLLKDSILFEDEEMIALNKPAGWGVQGGTNTTVHLDHLWKILAQEENSRFKEPPRIVHRLDKDTTGVVLFAKTLETARFLTQAFKEGHIQKTYWAITVGVPNPLEGTISLALKKRPGKGGEKMALDEDGKEAITLYKTLKTHKKEFSWLELTPQTGRTHQLRVHCAALNTPILGDGKYGGRMAHPLERRTSLMLHALAIEFTPPCGKKIRIEAPLPESMEKIRKRLF